MSSIPDGLLVTDDHARRLDLIEKTIRQIQRDQENIADTLNSLKKSNVVILKDMSEILKRIVFLIEK